MAISYLCGFDSGSLNEAFSVGGSISSVQNTKVHSAGGYALACASVNSNGFVNLESIASGTVLRSIFQSASFYLSLDGTPTTGILQPISIGSGTTAYQVELNWTNNFVRIMKNGAPLTSGSVAISSLDFTAWHRVDVDLGYNAGAGIRAYVDGVLMVSADSEAVAIPTTSMSFGAFSALLGTRTVYIDDIVIYNSTLPTVTDYNLSLLLPASDTAGGNWRRNDGTTTTGLNTAVKNRPPTGTAVTATLGTNYVQNGVAGSSVAADNLDLTTAAFTTITGLTQASQVAAVAALCNDAQQITTGSPKSGALATFSNPVTADQTFDFGIPSNTNATTAAVAQGANPVGWGTHQGAIAAAPSVTVGSGVGVRVKRTGTYTRVISVDFMGAYVMWTSLAKSLVFDEHRVRRNHLLRR